jgi:hypothetical protein
MADDAVGNARPPRYLRDGGVMHSHFIYCGQRGINQLLPSDWLHPYLWHNSTLTKPTSALSHRVDFTAVPPVESGLHKHY